MSGLGDIRVCCGSERLQKICVGKMVMTPVNSIRCGYKFAFPENASFSMNQIQTL